MFDQKLDIWKETQAPFAIPERRSSSYHPFWASKAPPAACTLGTAVGKVRGGLGGAKIITTREDELTGKVRLLVVDTYLIQIDV